MSFLKWTVIVVVCIIVGCAAAKDSKKESTKEDSIKRYMDVMCRHYYKCSKGVDHFSLKENIALGRCVCGQGVVIRYEYLGF